MRILPLKDLGMDVTNGDKDESIDDFVLANRSKSHDDSAFGKPRKYLPIKKEVVIDGKKTVAEGVDASQARRVMYEASSEKDVQTDADSHAANKEHDNDTELLEEEGVEVNEAENLNEELEHLDMTSETNESVDASFVDDQSSENIWMLRSLSESTIACVTAVILNSTADGKTYITSEELQKHNKASDLWISIQGKMPLSLFTRAQHGDTLIYSSPGITLITKFQKSQRFIESLLLSLQKLGCSSTIKKLHKKSLSTRACMERYMISCTASPKAASKPSAPAPPSPLLAALFTAELSQPSSARSKEGMVAVFQEIGLKPVTSFFFYFWSNPLINPVVSKIFLPLLFNLF
ncbi:hypothetical protein Tco_1028077 [Tanacetum coccineum]